MNRYLERRMQRQKMREESKRMPYDYRDMESRERDYRGDYKNPYGSQGGYVDSRMDYRGGRDYTDYPKHYGSERDGRYDMSSYGYGKSSDGHYPYKQYGEHHRPMEYEMRGIEEISARPYYGSDYRGGDYRGGDYRDYRMDYRGDYNDYAKEGKEQYEKDLHKWIEKLKSKETKFKISKEQVAQHAKSMGVKFDKFTEDEFYAVYLMLVSDYKNIGVEPTIYVRMAKDFLMDDDIAVSPSEKVCIYMYEIVMGEKE